MRRRCRWPLPINAARSFIFFSLSSSYGSLSAFCSSRGEPVCIYIRGKHQTHTHAYKKKQCFGGLDSFFFFAPFALLLPRDDYLEDDISSLPPTLLCSIFFFLSVGCVSRCLFQLSKWPFYAVETMEAQLAVELKREREEEKTERLRFISRTSHSHSYDLMSETGWWRLEIIIQATTNWDGDYRWRCQLKLRAPAVVGWLRVIRIYSTYYLSLSLSFSPTTV